MSGRVIQTEYDLGSDAYGRRVTMTSRRTYDGKDVWSIKSAAMSQLDDGERIESLSRENLVAIAAVLKGGKP